MYDFNPLASLFLLKSLPADLPLPSLRKTLRALLTLLSRSTPPVPHTPPFRHPPAVELKRAKTDRDLVVSHPSYNLPTPSDTDVPAK